MRTEFPSIINPNHYQFIYDTSSNFWSAPIHPYFVVRNLQSGSLDALSTELAADYFGSLASAMRDNDELCGEIGWRFQGPSDNENFEFAATVKYGKKDAKRTRYFSKELRRISSVKSKQYDRRFEPICSYMDGSLKQIFDMTKIHAMYGLGYYACAHAFRKWANDNPKKAGYMSDYPAEFLGWTTSDTYAYAVHYAWEAVLSVFAMYESKRNLNKLIDTFKNFAIQHKMVS
jgi:hypothetical protein